MAVYAWPASSTCRSVIGGRTEAHVARCAQVAQVCGILSVRCTAVLAPPCRPRGAHRRVAPAVPSDAHRGGSARWRHRTVEREHTVACHAGARAGSLASPTPNALAERHAAQCRRPARARAPPRIGAPLRRALARLENGGWRDARGERAAAAAPFAAVRLPTRGRRNAVRAGTALRAAARGGPGEPGAWGRAGWPHWRGAAVCCGQPAWRRIAGRLCGAAPLRGQPASHWPPAHAYRAWALRIASPPVAAARCATRHAAKPSASACSPALVTMASAPTSIRQRKRQVGLAKAAAKATASVTRGRLRLASSLVSPQPKPARRHCRRRQCRQQDANLRACCHSCAPADRTSPRCAWRTARR